MSTAFLILLCTAVGIAMLTFGPRNTTYPVNFKKLGYAFLGLALIALMSESFTIIEPGYVGVPVTFGNVGVQSLPAGIHPIFFLTDVYRMSVQTKDYTMSSVHNEGTKTGDDAVA